MENETLLQEEEVKQPDMDLEHEHELDMTLANARGFTRGYYMGRQDGEGTSNIREWRKGFWSGWGSAVAGFALGNVILVLINKKKNKQS